MKCQIQWIDEMTGRQTPDENEAVAMANIHKTVWSLPCGGPGNYLVGYTDEINQSLPICAHHMAQLERGKALDAYQWRGWSVSPLPEQNG